ncbi:TetR/AcrR family transcriptional regulator [Spongiactinospora rosea]|uniref:TetR/AcrR family transcriptional regulator n=1 Tax=Spongiactinospora rosea TaxID=2248750 RepID=A0A366LP50_9ACTN|nr:TetR/AcrR family transcriptional regulator C-terminal domain-containing protein [Spongiactinospora rosea]RBQ15735.1 TetR/AcrR family transcriptional regulator [Spongiactinospora rosea]
MSSSHTRRRPTHRKGRATLTRESVGRAALDFLGRYGPAELTMRSLATELGVSPRALYNYVEDRRDLITVAAEIFESGWHSPPLDPARWREDLRAFCRELRAHYRRHPGMTTLAYSENITMARHPVMLRNVDALIGLFAQIGLPLQDAYRACMETIRLVAGFVELQDSLHDRPPAHVTPDDLDRLPPPWLRGSPEDLPYLSRTATLEPDSPDTLFDFAVDILVAGIAARLPA